MHPIAAIIQQLQKRAVNVVKTTQKLRTVFKLLIISAI